MTPWRAIGLACLLLGVGTLAYGAATGAVRVGFFLVFPYVVGTGLAPFLGTLLVMAGLFALFVGSFAPRIERAHEAPPPQADVERRSRSGGVVLLGPIPIVWGSDRRILPWMVAAGLALTLLLAFVALR